MVVNSTARVLFKQCFIIKSFREKVKNIIDNYDLAKCWVPQILGHLKKFKYLHILVLFQKHNESQSIPLNLQPALSTRIEKWKIIVPIRFRYLLQQRKSFYYLGQRKLSLNHFADSSSKHALILKTGISHNLLFWMNPL